MRSFVQKFGKTCVSAAALVLISAPTFAALPTVQTNTGTSTQSQVNTATDLGPLSQQTGANGHRGYDPNTTSNNINSTNRITPTNNTRQSSPYTQVTQTGTNAKGQRFSIKSLAVDLFGLFTGHYASFTDRLFEIILDDILKPFGSSVLKMATSKVKVLSDIEKVAARTTTTNLNNTTYGQCPTGNCTGQTNPNGQTRNLTTTTGYNQFFNGVQTTGQKSTGK